MSGLPQDGQGPASAGSDVTAEQPSALQQLAAIAVPAPRRCELRAQAILSELTSRTKPWSVYHYTTPSGLLGILNSRSIWAGDARHLNDSSELVYVESVLQRVLEAELQDENEGGSFPLLYHMFRPQMFMAAFSEAPDVLSQWRAYANDGAGYALGIDTRVPFKNDGHIQLAPVLYSIEEQENIVRELIAVEREEYDPQSPAEWALLKSRCMTALRVLAPFMKNPGFAEEREWRVVVPFTTFVPIAPSGFRESRFGVSPYLSLQWASEKLPITELWLGPKLASGAAGSAAYSLIQHCGFNEEGRSDVDLHHSATSYR